MGPLARVTGSVGRRYRASGADLPYADPLRAHGVAMEGYFWRFTEPESGRVIIALNGINRASDGPADARHWATLGVAAHPSGFLKTVVYPTGRADTEKLGAYAGDAFVGTAHRLDVDLGADTQIHVELVEPVPWPRKRWGGSSIFQTVPGLNQYWHPWLLGGYALGHAVIGGERVEIDGWSAYGEKNWGKGGFPESWWWGQAQGFDEPQACVAFAGGQVHAGPLRTTVTAVVVLLPDGTLIRLGDPMISPVRAEVSDEHWRLRGRNATWSVEIDGAGVLSQAHVLPVPLPAERRNIPGAIEHLGAHMSVVVRRRGVLVWKGDSAVAALENGGIARAQAEVVRRGGTLEDTQAAPVR